MKLINNTKGVALLELLAAIPLSILVFVILIVGIVNFVTTYQEVRLFKQLQEELFDTVETLRYGYTKADVTGRPNEPDQNKEGLIGLLTARKIDFGTTGSSITIYPPLIEKTVIGHGFISMTINISESVPDTGRNLFITNLSFLLEFIRLEKMSSLKLQSLPLLL